MKKPALLEKIRISILSLGILYSQKLIIKTADFVANLAVGIVLMDLRQTLVEACLGVKIEVNNHLILLPSVLRYLS